MCTNQGTANITLEATGTAAPFTFTWEGPDSYTSTTQNPNDITIPGTYTVIVTNAYGCETALSTQIVNCDGIDVLDLQVDNTCEGGATGSVKSSITGGTSPFSYQWNNGSQQADILYVTAGEYSLTVTDDNGCTAEQCATVESEQLFTATFNLIHACGNTSEGSIDVTTTGGASLSYNWSNGATTQNINNLSAGIYTLTLSNTTYGCSLIESVSIENLSVPQIEADITYSSCANIADGSISLNITGGELPYTILWDDVDGATTASISNLLGSVYCVTVTGANTCAVEACYSTLGDTPQVVMPYIQQVQVFAMALNDATEMLIYDAKWLETASGCIVFIGGMESISSVLFTSMGAGEQSLRIEATPSKEMDDLSLTIEGLVTPDDVLGNGLWGFTVNETTTAAFTANNSFVLGH